MRKFPVVSTQNRYSEDFKPRSSMNRKQAPLRDLADTNNSPAKSVKQLDPMGENSEGLRHLIREQVELMRRQQHKLMQEGFKQLRTELCQLRDAIDEKPDRKGLDNYLNARLQQLSLQSHSKNQELRNMVGHLDRSVNEKLQQAQLNLEVLNRQLPQQATRAVRKNTADNSKLQMLESNVEFLFDKIDAMAEGRSSLTKKKEVRYQRHESPAKVETPQYDFEREIRALRNQFKLEMAELSQGIEDIEEEVQESVRQLKQKISMTDISETLEELNEKITQSAIHIEKVSNSLDELHDERDTTERTLAKLQQKSSRFQSTLDTAMSELRCDLQQQMSELLSETEHRFSGLISSYNANFQEIDEATNELKEMVSQILSINNIITQKLIGTITNKLDCMTFESAMENLNDQVISNLHVNNRKLNEIGDKEFEVEHELKAMKEMMGSLKREWDKRKGLAADDERYSLCESERKSRRGALHGANWRGDLSPYIMSPRIEETCRFRKTDASMYEHVGGRYNGSERKPIYAQVHEEEDEVFETSAYSQIPSLSEELASME